MGWRERLRDAVRQSGRKHSVVALDAGIAAETLSRVLSGKSAAPAFETIARIAYAAGVPLGWILDEKGFDLSPAQIGQILDAIAFLQHALENADTYQLLRLRSFLEDGTLCAAHPTVRKDVQGEHAWRTMVRRVRQDEYRERVAELLPLLKVFRRGRLETGSSGMIFVLTPDREEVYAGGAHPEAAKAIADAVNLVLDLTAAEPEGRPSSR